MTIEELSRLAFEEMENIAFDKRKDIYSQFEFDYINKIKDTHYIIKSGSDYIFKNKETNEVSSINIKASKNGSYTQLKSITYKTHTNDLYTHLIF